MRKIKDFATGTGNNDISRKAVREEQPEENQLKTPQKGKIFGILSVVLVIAALVLSGCAKKPSFKKLPPPKKPRVTAPAQRPEVQKPVSQPGARSANIRPSVADTMTPKRLASLHLVERGKSMLANSQFEQAARVFRDAANVDSSNGVAYYFLAEANINLGQTEAATGLLDKAEALLGADEEWMGRINELKQLIDGQAAPSSL